MRHPSAWVVTAPVILWLAGCGDPDRSEAERSNDPTTFTTPATPILPAEANLASYIEAGVELYYAGEIDSARLVLLAAATDAEQAADTAARARALTWLGLAAWRQGDYSQAQALGRQALDLKLSGGLTEQLYRSYNALGLVAWHETRLTEAAQMFGKALEAARAVGDDRGIAGASGNLGLVHTDLGEFALARADFETLRDAGRVLGSPLHEANGLTNLGMLDIMVGDPLSAVAALNEARTLYRSEGLANEEVAVRQLGDAYAVLGELSRAHAMYDTALAMAREQGDRQAEAANLEVLAALYRDIGDHARALEFYSEARTINSEIGLLLETGKNLRGAALTYFSLGDPGRAEQQAVRALEMHRGIGAPFEELQNVLILAELAYLGGRPAELRDWLSRARELSSGLDARATRIAVALTEARIAEAAGEASAVLAALEAVESDLARGDYASEWEADALRARAYLRSGDLDSAAAAGRRAVNTVERVRRNLASGVLRTAFTSARNRTYSDLVAILLRLGRPAEALEVADAARARALSEHLAATGRETGTFDETARGYVQGEQLLRRIDLLADALHEVELLTTGLADSWAAAEVQDRVRRLTDARREYEALLIRLAQRDPSAAAWLGGAWPSASTIQQTLGPGEILLEYMVTPDRLLIFVVTAEELRIAESTIGSEDLATRVRFARELLHAGATGDAGAAEGTDVLESLHGFLVEPAARAASLYDADRLIIVPHDVLTYLPFAALRDGVTGRYLAEEFSLLHLPSAAALPAVRMKSRGTVSRGEMAAQALAPFPDELPGSRREVDAVRTALPGSEASIGAAATEARARQALSGRGIVHVATHGIMNPKNPMFSRLELRPGADGRSTDDGRLEVHELLALKIRSPLVFLSGCETGLGSAWSRQFLRGEDFATLARAFLYAGSENVLATLWRLEDESAAVFAEHFYAALGERAPADALALAQRAMIA
ncbi:MAG: CHAT domain-containing protein, partial [Gemmatimonadota bacterium]